MNCKSTEVTGSSVSKIVKIRRGSRIMPVAGLFALPANWKAANNMAGNGVVNTICQYLMNLYE
jgi:hypothetical protein